MSQEILQVEERSLYPALQRMLSKAGWSPSGSNRKNNRHARFYKFTPEGRKQLERELREFGLVMILTVACADTANLLLARATARREMAMLLSMARAGHARSGSC